VEGDAYREGTPIALDAVASDPSSADTLSYSWQATKNGDLFIKRFDPVPDAMYPDFGCAVELFANDLIAEVETVAPLTTLEPGESASHVERWYLFSGVQFDGTQEALEKNVLPCVKGTR